MLEALAAAAAGGRKGKNLNTHNDTHGNHGGGKSTFSNISRRKTLLVVAAHLRAFTFKLLHECTNKWGFKRKSVGCDIIKVADTFCCGISVKNK